jgi:hypothetical protein
MVGEADQHLSGAVVPQQRVARPEERTVRDVVKDHVREDDNVEPAHAAAAAVTPRERQERSRIVAPLVPHRDDGADLSGSRGGGEIGKQVFAEHIYQRRVRIVGCSDGHGAVEGSENGWEASPGPQLEDSAATADAWVCVK